MPEPIDASQQQGDGQQAQQAQQAQPGAGEKTFTQAELNEIIQGRLAKAEEKWKTKLPSDEQVEKWKELETKAAAEEEEKMKQQGEWDKMKASLQEAHQKNLSEKDLKIEEQGKFIESLVIDKSILEAATKNDAIDPSVVSKLLRDKVRLGENFTPFVADEQGKPVYDKGDLMSIETMVGDYLAKNPYLVKPTSAKGGSGYQPSGNAPASGKQSATEVISNQLQKALGG